MGEFINHSEYQLAKTHFGKPALVQIGECPIALGWIALFVAIGELSLVEGADGLVLARPFEHGPLDEIRLHGQIHGQSL
ncbi:MAG: hypothetical protein B6D36_19210 [Planctomycetes bacterium UTPLA1]|nr:MAG: hypothetical protein B6D36_19210 [Planctomycetes bacterium UTPLA1]